MYKRIKLGPYLILQTVNSKQIKDLNVRDKTTRLKRKYRWKSLGSFITHDFTGMKATAQERKEKTSLKFKTCASRTLSRKWKDNPQNGRRYLQIIFGKGLIIFRIYKEGLQSNNKKTNIPVKQWAKNVTDISQKKK